MYGTRGRLRQVGALLLGAVALLALTIVIARKKSWHAKVGPLGSTFSPSAAGPLGCAFPPADASDLVDFDRAARLRRPPAPRPRGVDDSGRIDFTHQVLPILAQHCYPCHGPAESGRRADLRLDQRETALAVSSSGRPVIRPYDPDGSELIARIESPASDQMPPEGFRRHPAAREVEVLRRWISQGADYALHWAYIPPANHTPPASGSGWARNGIDAFIRARLEKEGLAPSPPADPTTLIRRLSLGLTGLPPTPAEVDAFVNDPSPDAYERLVDRLLASPHHGEHAAAPWLDLARYADTSGGTVDDARDLWLYRDWVVAAFNDNLPFDRFTVEQLAGDLLPNPTLSQQIATGFLRSELLQKDTCADEQVACQLVDRVSTTATVWLGSTFGCAQCHDHKYDPTSQRDFYRLGAFFNNFPHDEKGHALHGFHSDGLLKLPPTPAQQERIDRARAALARADGAIAQLVSSTRAPEGPVPAKPPEERVWVDGALPAEATPDGEGPWDFVPPPIEAPRARLCWQLAATGVASRGFSRALPPLRVEYPDVLFAWVYLDPKDPPKTLLLQFEAANPEHRATWGPDLIPWGEEGKPSRRQVGPLPEAGRWVRLEVPAEVVDLGAGAELTGLTIAQFDGTAWWGPVGVSRSMRAESLADWEEFERRRNDPVEPPAAIRAALKVEPKARTETQQAQLKAHFVEHVYAPCWPAFTRLHAERDRAAQELAAAEADVPSTLVMAELSSRPDTFLLRRGDFSQRAEKVEPGVPAYLPPCRPG
jgi:hypothetical protein